MYLISKDSLSLWTLHILVFLIKETCLLGGKLWNCLRLSRHWLLKPWWSFNITSKEKTSFESHPAFFLFPFIRSYEACFSVDHVRFCKDSEEMSNRDDTEEGRSDLRRPFLHTGSWYRMGSRQSSMLESSLAIRDSSISVLACVLIVALGPIQFGFTVIQTQKISHLSQFYQWNLECGMFCFFVVVVVV